MSKKLNNLEKVFSMTNDNYHKVITIVGIKWKFKSKKLLKKYNIKSNSFLEDIFSIKNEKRENIIKKKQNFFMKKLEKYDN